MTRKTEERDWDSYAMDYDALNELSPYRQMMAEIIARIDLQAGRCVLDAACGSGNLAYWCDTLGHFRGARLVGIDRSEAMLALAARKCGKFYHRLLQMDFGKDLALPDNYFDQIVSSLTLYAAPDPELFLKNLHRLARKDCRLIIVTPKKDYENGLIMRAHLDDGSPEAEWLDAHASEEREEEIIRRCFGQSQTAERFLRIARYNRQIRADSFYFPEKAELLGLLEDCGFKLIECREVYAKQDYLVVAKKRS